MRPGWVSWAFLFVGEGEKREPVMTLRISRAEQRALSATARSFGLSRSALVRLAVRRFVEAEQTQSEGQQREK